MSKVVSEISKYILATLIGSLVFLLCWGLCFVIGKIVMKHLGVL